MTNPDVNGVVNLSPKIQACLNEVAKDTRRGRREVVITGKGSSNLIGLGSQLIMPTKCSLIFDTDTRLKPLVNNVYGVECSATYPTVWVNLSVDAFKYLDRITVTDASTFNIDDQIIIMSQLIIDTSPNMAGSVNKKVDGVFVRKPAKVGQQCKIWAKEGNTLLLDQCLNYDYFLTDTAQVGKITDPKEDIKLLNFKMGDFTDTIRGGNAVRLRYVYKALIDTVNIKHNREVDNDDDDESSSTSNDGSTRNGILLVGGKHIVIKNVYLSRIGWYGIGYEGCIENLKVYDFECHFARHSISANWFNHPHEPRDIYIYNARSFESTFAGFDTHDVGYNINYENCIAIGSKQDAGFQFRTSNITLKNCISRGNKIGIVSRSKDQNTYTPKVDNPATVVNETEVPAVPIDLSILLEARKRLQNYKIENCDIQDNEKAGINLSSSPEIIGSKIVNNGFTESFSGGLAINGGLIKDCLIENNTFCAVIYGRSVDWNGLTVEKLVLDNITAKANETQTRLFSSANSGTGTEDYEKLELRNSDVRGYSLNNRFYANTEYPRSEKVVQQFNNIWGESKLYGGFNLISGQQYIPNDNVFSSNVLITPINKPVIEGITNKALDGVALGIGESALPDTWKLAGALNPLVLEVISFNQNVLEPYVDIRLYGVASPSTFQLYFMDRYDKDHRPGTIQNDSWLLKFKADLLAGSMANVTNSFYVVEYDDTLVDPNTSVVSTVIPSSTVVITSTETEFTKTYVIDDVTTTSFLYGLRFNTTIGGTIDCTIRIKNPSAILGSATPITQSTLVAELREPKGFVVTSYNSDGSINTNDNRKCSYVL
jgi:hypothetical protein